MPSLTTNVLLFALAVSAAPTPIELMKRQEPFEVIEQQPWDAGAVYDFRIHSSCNASQAYQLRQGLNEAVELAQHAKDHVNRWGHTSDIYRKYFGSSAPTTDVIGAFDIVINGNKEETLFRCDDPDGNCELMPSESYLVHFSGRSMLMQHQAWGGHYRGDNASHETVICPTSFFERRPLSTLCAQGYNVRESSRLLFWASDLLHRLYHLPEVGQGIIDHYAEGYEGIVEAAANNSTNTTRDSDGLQYFALEAYAYDMILPGEGCPGPSGPLASETSSSMPAATATSAASASSASATTTASSAESTAASSATTASPAAAEPSSASSDSADADDTADSEVGLLA